MSPCLSPHLGSPPLCPYLHSSDLLSLFCCCSLHPTLATSPPPCTSVLSSPPVSSFLCCLTSPRLLWPPAADLPPHTTTERLFVEAHDLLFSSPLLHCFLFSAAPPAELSFLLAAESLICSVSCPPPHLSRLAAFILSAPQVLRVSAGLVT